MNGVLRQPHFAGSFYSANPSELASEITALLDKVVIPPDARRPQGIVAPHAGYMYSGACAAAAYARVRHFRDTYQTVVVISPSHRSLFDYSSVFDGDGYETPLGIVPIASDIVAKIGASAGAQISQAGHIDGNGPEHALEVQLPFLQVALHEFRLVPIVMGLQTPALTAQLAQAIADAVDPRTTLLVASSDLSHFHNAGTAAKLDGRVIAAVAAFDPHALMTLINTGKAEACGFCPITAVMMACWQLGARTARALDYRHSGQVSGDNDEVVGYLAAEIL